ncbi:MAG: NDP-sugar synthase [Candidatus Paceibacterota bacterium]|jgi:NDP-sugar pyrophosphorylase family protein
MFKNLVILAAGRSVRMWPLTEYVPKAMALADNKTLLEINFEKYKPLGFNIHLTVGYKSDILSPHALVLGVSSLVNTNGKGNAWWIYNSILSKLDEPIMILTCDGLMDIDLKDVEKEYKKFGEPACMLVPTQVKDGFDGDCIHQKDGLITKLSRTEKTDIYGSGCQILNPKKIIELTKNSDDFLEVWNQLMKKKQLYCSSSLAKNWYTFDSVEQLKSYRCIKEDMKADIEICEE